MIKHQIQSHRLGKAEVVHLETDDFNRVVVAAGALDGRIDCFQEIDSAADGPGGIELNG